MHVEGFLHLHRRKVWFPARRTIDSAAKEGLEPINRSAENRPPPLRPPLYHGLFPSIAEEPPWASIQRSEGQFRGSGRIAQFFGLGARNTFLWFDFIGGQE